MKIRTLFSALILSACAGVASGQQTTGNARVIAAMTLATSKYTAPACAASKGNHFKVSSGATYLQTAIDKSDPAIKARALNDAQRVILEAIQQNQQENSPGAWYYLGRVDLHKGDLAGADSALARAQKLAPDCKENIDLLRRTAYVALVNPAVDMLNAGKSDSALVLFRDASGIFHDAPQAYYYAATLYYNQKAYDTSVVYFGKALDTPTDPKDTQLRAKANFYRGLAFVRLNRPADALPSLRAYAAAAPDDLDAKKALINAFNAAGQGDSAAVYQKQLLSSGDQSAGAGDAGASDAMTIGQNFYRQKKYSDAIAAFEKVLASDPNNRDALYLLAYAYVGTVDGVNLLKTARKLLAIDPLNEDAHKLLGEGYRLTKNAPERQKAAEQLLALPVNVQVKTFTPRPDGASLSGTITGRDAQGARGPLKPAAMTLTFDLLDKSGTVIGTQDVAVGALAAGTDQPLTVDAKGTGAVAWRYKKKV